jgi:hypothetical protein
MIEEGPVSFVTSSHFMDSDRETPATRVAGEEEEEFYDCKHIWVILIFCNPILLTTLPFRNNCYSLAISKGISDTTTR